MCDKRDMEQMTLAVAFKRQPRLHELEDILTNFGGDPDIALTGDLRGGCLPVLDLDEQIKNGGIFKLKSNPEIRPKKADEPNRCHQNSIDLFDKDPANVVASGFALDNDGKWYHHSWCIREQDGERVIIETIEGTFRQYFGLEYRGQEAVERLRKWLKDSWPELNLERKPGSITDIAQQVIDASDDPARAE